MSASYSRRFYATRQGGSSASAEVVVPLLIAQFPVRSVVDVGCGTGLWIEAFVRRGVSDYLGVDGGHVAPDMLHIAKERFRGEDLTQLETLGRRFDVACSMEVAEHLPASRAENFVALLTEAAPVVLFSAAIPHQGGTGHINEQWQAYWSALFAKRGYVALDFIRPAIDGDPRVDWWYRQNIIVYCEPSAVPGHLTPVTDSRQLNYVDPEMVELLAGGAGGIREAAHAVVRDVVALGRALGTVIAGSRPRPIVSRVPDCERAP
ncbi:MAG TPA: class I SAM-dependent methyltransferase [Stellaceae bacterium]|nr:class I SAM-dependent methyltransferase [Stellaceae bacterium]